MFPFSLLLVGTDLLRTHTDSPPYSKDEEETGHNLKMEVQTLRGRCDEHKKKIDDLESRCDTHERVIEMLWQEIVGLKDVQNTLSTTYHGERYDMIP